MALIRRVARLITADVHAVLDQIEEPEIVLKQAIREMEEQLARQTQHGKWLAREIEAAEARLGGLASTVGDLDAKLDLAFGTGDEALARKLTRRKLEAEKLTRHVEEGHGALTRELAEHEARLASNRDELEGLRQKAALFSVETAAACDEAARDGFAGIDETDVEIEFLREKQARQPT